MSIRRKEQTGRTTIRNIIHNLGMEERLLSIEVDEIWKRMMGENIAEHTTKITARLGELIIYLDSPVLREELTRTRTKILSAINEELGEEYFNKLKFF